MKTCLRVLLLGLVLAGSSCAGPGDTAAPARQDYSGLPVAGSGPAVYRVMEDGQLRHISDWATFLALGYQPGQIVQLAPEEIARHPLGLPLTRWITGETDTRLYFLLRGQRYLISDEHTLQITGGDTLSVVPVPDAFLNSFPLAADPIRVTDLYTPPAPAITGAVWADGALWVAGEGGPLRRWDGQTWSTVELPGAVSALASQGGFVYAGTTTGDLWQISGDMQPELQASGQGEQIAALGFLPGGIFMATASQYRLDNGVYVPGGAIRKLMKGSNGASSTVGETGRSITALALDGNNLWYGTQDTGLVRYDLSALAAQPFTMFNSAIPDHAVTDLALDAAGTLWLTTPSRLSKLVNGQIEVVRDGVPSSSLALAADGAIWLAGENALGRLDGPIYTAFDHPLLLDTFDFVVLDDQQTPWFVGREHLIHFDGQGWTAYDLQTGAATPFQPDRPPLAEPLDFPPPGEDYTAWLQTWPRPARDNGRCMHYLQTPAGDTYQVWEQVTRLEQLGVRWVLVNYTNPSQLLQMAPIFARAGIMVIWRPFVRPYQEYSHWAQDVTFLRGQGLPPYIQVYNEPNLPPEWDGQPVDQAVYLDHLVSAVRQVIDAGGYVGLQEIDLDWTRATLQRLKAEGMGDVFDRVFFVPHPYGANHPPEYQEDSSSVLSFLDDARVFEEAIGFVPVMIAGEGGWRLGENADPRYPPVSEELHRDYHVAVFEWFRTGQLSNGEPLPDYLFAFCPWLLSDPTDPAAWYDSSAGPRQLTIDAVEALPYFER